MNEPSNYRSANGEQAVMALYDRALANWLVPCDTAQIHTRHGSTFVIANGDPAAPPLVLLHGANSNAVSWIGDAAAYSRRHRVYAVDIPGEPGKSAANRPSWDGPAFAEWLTDLLNGLGIGATALLGLSQGGWIALKFATTCPERVTRLVLLAPGGVSSIRLSFILRAIPLSMLGRRGAEALNRITFGAEPIHPDAIAFMDAIMTHFKPRIGAQHIYTDDELRRLIMPTLLIVGAQDALYCSEKTVARLGALVPDLTLRMLPDKGHVLVGLTDEIERFLAAEA